MTWTYICEQRGNIPVHIRSSSKPQSRVALADLCQISNEAAQDLLIIPTEVLLMWNHLLTLLLIQAAEKAACDVKWLVVSRIFRDNLYCLAWLKRKNTESSDLELIFFRCWVESVNIWGLVGSPEHLYSESAPDKMFSPEQLTLRDIRELWKAAGQPQELCIL